MSEQLGLGVLINRLFGSNGAEHVIAAIGKTIARVSLDGPGLRLVFTDGTAIDLFDDGQSCCESRYMNCDDPLDYYVGAQLMNVEIADAPDEPSEHGDDHEVQFLRVTTSKGVLSCANHNEHNGYYGGFSIRASQVSNAR